MHAQRICRRAPLSRAHRSLGLAIAEMRRRHDLTQDQLGYDTGLRYQNIDELERGVQNPTFRTLLHLSRGLGEPISELMALYENLDADRIGP